MTLPALQSKVLNDDDLTRHRAYIAVKAQALMGRYFQLPQDELVKREILLGWMDMLQDFTREEIDAACKQYLIDYPRTRPHEGLIAGLINAKRRQYLASLPKPDVAPSAPRKNPDPEFRKKFAAEVLGRFAKR